MKMLFVGLSLLFASAAANAACVGVQQQFDQYCAMLTDQATCQELQGLCVWKSGTDQSNQCTGENPMCTMLPDQQTCTMYGCTWGH